MLLTSSVVVVYHDKGREGFVNGVTATSMGSQSCLASVNTQGSRASRAYASLLVLARDVVGWAAQPGGWHSWEGDRMRRRATKEMGGLRLRRRGFSRARWVSFAQGVPRQVSNEVDTTDRTAGSKLRGASFLGCLHVMSFWC